MSERALARTQQAEVEHHRLMRHQTIALALVAGTPAAGELIDQAKAMVARWKAERLCSADYIDRWTALLELAPSALAEAIVSDLDGWGQALRQNSPWVGRVDVFDPLQPHHKDAP